MTYSRQIYLLNPKELSPETIAVTFAKTSHSPLTFREIAAELTDEQSAQFHEKWVVGYGHASVAEHAVLHIALENVSRLAIENIESNRLASYTEKSTRYQKWNPDSYFTPPELAGHALLPVYQETCLSLFKTYLLGLETVKKVAVKENPRNRGESEAGWERRLRSICQDVCRFLLPACSLANVGMTANARVLEHAIQKMLSSPLLEVQQIGADVKKVAQAEVPTLVKYADRLSSLDEIRSTMETRCVSMSGQDNPIDWCQLVCINPQGENVILAGLLYRFAQTSFDTCLDYVTTLSPADRKEFINDAFERLGNHDLPLRELEHASYTFDLVFDQGAFCEVKRHRMMTQTPQLLTACLGYAIPRLITTAGFEADYCQAMDKAQQAYEQLAGWNRQVAAYIVPNGFNRRMLMTLNLREAYHFCSLRSAENAHFSVRRVALKIAEQIQKQHPSLAANIRLPVDTTWKIIENQFFSQT